MGSVFVPGGFVTPSGIRYDYDFTRGLLQEELYELSQFWVKQLNDSERTEKIKEIVENIRQRGAPTIK
jgi:hypothetical protein